MIARPGGRLALRGSTALAVLAGACWLAGGLGGCVSVPDQSSFTRPASHNGGPVVQLRAARIPYVRNLAVHCWLIAYDPDEQRWHRWEVWQTAGTGTGYWGHLRRDKSGPPSGVGAGGSWALAEWHGREARQLTAVLNQPENYPYCHEYRYVPGPNSNTYVAWVLDQAGMDLNLPFAAVGAGYD